MWKYRYALVCALGALMLSTARTDAQSGDPSLLPRIAFTDLTYLGAFRLPDQFVNGDGFTIGGHPVTFNPSRNSLFIGSRNGNIAEVTVPAVVNSNNVSSLQFAAFLQGFYEPTQGNLGQIATSGVAIDGLLVHADRLYGSASIYYDANNTQRLSHYSRSTTLSAASFVGMRQVWQDERAGFVSGYMATVPPEWQARLGGQAITGQCCVPIAWRTSWGPSAFAWNPADIATSAKVPATPLLYYTDSHATLGRWDTSNPVYGGTTQINGVAVLAGTRTALFFGRNGTGPFCYGNGTADTALVGRLGPDNEIYCYDPAATSKGQHAYPYNYQIWAYDLNDLAAVRAGTKQPWEVQPYGVWPFSLPFNEPQVRIGGIGYDSSRQIIYISQMYADQDGYGYRPLIHALKVGGGAAGTPLPTPDTTPLPPLPTTPSTKVSSVAVTADRVAPQPAGTTITWTAAATGGVAPYEYKWLVYENARWTVKGGWSTSNTYAWTPSAADPNYRVGVWVKSAGNSADVEETSTSVQYPIGGSGFSAPTPPPTTSARTTAVALSANRAAPQAPGTTITWTATPAGGTAPHQYKWLVYENARWTAKTAWTTANTYAWTPTAADPYYSVGVWVRSAGNTADAEETSTSLAFAITGTASTTPPPATTPPPPATTTPTARVNSVTMTPNMAAPQPPGRTITFSAVPNGGAAPHQYKWLVYDGARWNAIGSWTTSSTLNWTPGMADPNYRVGVWVRSNGNTADAEEASANMSFPIAGTAVATSPSGPAPNTGTTVSLAANRTAPQPPNTAITFTANAAGGSAPHSYKWYVFDGSTWLVVSGWSTNNTYTWVPTASNALYRVQVWVRSSGNYADSPEGTTQMPFAIGSSTTTSTTTTPASAKVSAVSVSANRIAPQPLGVATTFTAIATGGTGPLQYKWLVYDGASWVVQGGWTTSSTFNWTPARRDPNYRVGVWVKSAGNAADVLEASNSLAFPIQ